MGDGSRSNTVVPASVSPSDSPDGYIWPVSDEAYDGEDILGDHDCAHDPEALGAALVGFVLLVLILSIFALAAYYLL